MSARNMNSWVSTWWAASVGVSTRAATAVAVFHTANIASERTAKCTPLRSSFLHPLARRPIATAVRAQHPQEHQRRADLHDHRAPRRAGDTEVEPVDGDDLEDHVDDVGDQHDLQRLAQIVDPAHHAVADVGDQARTAARRS